MLLTVENTEKTFMREMKKMDRDFLNEEPIPWLPGDRTEAETVTGIDGDENAVFVSASFHVPPKLFGVFCRNYEMSWNACKPDRLTVRRDRKDAQPVIDMGLATEIVSGNGSDFPVPSSWTLIYPQPSMYRNGPFFFHQFRKVTLKFQADGRNGGKYQIAVTCSPDSIEYCCAYLPPVTESEDRLACTRMLLYDDGRGSFTDSDGFFTSRCDYIGYFYHDLNGPMTSTDSLMAPPFCIPVHRRTVDEWFGISAEPELAQMNFSLFNIEPSDGNRISAVFEYSSPYPLGHAAVLPPLVIRFGAKDEFDVLKKHADNVSGCGKVTRPERHVPFWWRLPIVCGWREQTNRWQKAGYASRAYDYCTQAVYEELTDYLEKHQLPYGTLVIDAIWSVSEERWDIDREKWPDMRGFIDRMHSRGKHVLLWVCPNAGSLPDDECYITERDIMESAGPDAAHRQVIVRRSQKRMTDPLSPGYRERIFRCMHTMLSSEQGCLDADGIKLDYTGGMPSGNIMRSTRPLYGYRYLYEQFSLYHDAAKAAKPDCLLEFQSANPYLAGFFDMTRLNDYLVAPGLGRAFETMSIRARLAESENYGALTDVDGIRSLDYIRRMDGIGVPAIYLGVDDFEQFPEYMSAARETAGRWLEQIRGDSLE